MPAEKPRALTARPVTRLQQCFTRLRFVLALPAAAALLYLARPGVPLWPGILVAAFGEYWQLWAAAHLHKNVNMVQSGPYALLRNPMYFGRFFVGLGLILTWKWYLVAAYVVVFALYAQARVLGEEARLRGLFGEPYEAYCRAVNRWFPWPRTRLSDARWSWEAVRRNHQLRVSLGVALMLMLVWWRVHYLAAFGWGP